MKQTAQQILDVAQDLVRCRGYSAFSYADISKQVGIRKASIHYHFPTKEDLAKALVERYRFAFGQKLKQIEASGAAPDTQLRQFVGLYWDGLSDCQMCLCGMLSAEIEVLPDAVRAEVRDFLAITQTWLAATLTNGDRDAEAVVFLASLQGAQLIAHTAENSQAAFDGIALSLLNSVGIDV